MPANDRTYPALFDWQGNVVGWMDSAGLFVMYRNSRNFIAIDDLSAFPPVEVCPDCGGEGRKGTCAEPNCVVHGRRLCPTCHGRRYVKARTGEKGGEG